MIGTNLVLDTNIIIYFLQGNMKANALVLNNNITISYITEIELLGYWNNTEKDVEIIKDLLSSFRIIYSNTEIKEAAIELRRLYRVKTPDSIIGAAALYLDISVVTADSGLFDIPELSTVKFFL